MSHPPRPQSIARCNNNKDNREPLDLRDQEVLNMRAMQILRLISSCELQPTAGETDRRTCFVPVESRGLTCVRGEPSPRHIWGLLHSLRG